MKDALGNLRDRPATHLQITTYADGVWEVEREGNTVVLAPVEFERFLGLRVYVAGKRLIDVEAAKPVPGVGNVTRTEKIWR